MQQSQYSDDSSSFFGEIATLPHTESSSGAEITKDDITSSSRQRLSTRERNVDQSLYDYFPIDQPFSNGRGLSSFSNSFYDLRNQSSFFRNGVESSHEVLQEPYNRNTTRVDYGNHSLETGNRYGTDIPTLRDIHYHREQPTHHYPMYQFNNRNDGFHDDQSMNYEFHSFVNPYRVPPDTRLNYRKPSVLSYSIPHSPAMRNHNTINDSSLSESPSHSLRRDSFSTASPSHSYMEEISDFPGSDFLQSLLHLSSYYDISKCNPQIAIANVDLNPNADRSAKLCYDFLNTGKCRREKKHGCCAYRHLPENHIHAIVERIRSGKQSVCLVQQKDDLFVIGDLPTRSSLPGELNPKAKENADLCEEFLIIGKCLREMHTGQCPNRHLVACHPERISYLFQHHLLTENEINAWILTPCGDLEVNPFSRKRDKICHDFLTTGVCSRFQSGSICRCRHLLPGHPDR